MHIVDDENNNNNNNKLKKRIKTIHSTSDISASNDQELLGNITAPNEITETNLNFIAPNCLRGSVRKCII